MVMMLLSPLVVKAMCDRETLHQRRPGSCLDWYRFRSPFFSAVVISGASWNMIYQTPDREKQTCGTVESEHLMERTSSHDIPQTLGRIHASISWKAFLQSPPLAAEEAGKNGVYIHSGRGDWKRPYKYSERKTKSPKDHNTIHGTLLYSNLFHACP